MCWSWKLIFLIAKDTVQITVWALGFQAGQNHRMQLMKLLILKKENLKPRKRELLELLRSYSDRSAIKARLPGTAFKNSK